MRSTPRRAPRTVHRRTEPGRRSVAPVAGPHRRHRLRNLAQELLMLTGLAVILGAVAWLLTGLAGLLWVLLTMVVLGALRPRVPTAWVLSLYRAQPLPRWAAPRLHAVVDELAVRARLHRRPDVFYVASPTANAFVVGRQDDAALALTDGLLRLLDDRELAGVVAHEISHLHNGDPEIMSLSDLVARLAQWTSWVGLWSVLVSVPLAVDRASVVPVLLSLLLVAVPTVVTLLQLAMSRAREYDADVEAVALTGDPEGLARALVILQASDGQIWERILVGRSTGSDPLVLQTHPATDQRVQRLLDLPVESRPAPTDLPGGPTVVYPPVTERPRLRRHGIRW